MGGRLACIKRNMPSWSDVLLLNMECLMLLSGLVRYSLIQTMKHVQVFIGSKRRVLT